MYAAEFWICDKCAAVDMDPASDHDPDTFIEREQWLGTAGTA